MVQQRSGMQRRNARLPCRSCRQASRCVSARWEDDALFFPAAMAKRYRQYLLEASSRSSEHCMNCPPARRASVPSVRSTGRPRSNRRGCRLRVSPTLASRPCGAEAVEALQARRGVSHMADVSFNAALEFTRQLPSPRLRSNTALILARATGRPAARWKRLLPARYSVGVSG